MNEHEVTDRRSALRGLGWGFLLLMLPVAGCLPFSHSGRHGHGSPRRPRRRRRRR